MHLSFRKQLRLHGPVFCAAAFSLLGMPGSSPSTAAALQEPPVFTSANGTLSVLMIAAERKDVTLGPVTTNLWTYEVCPLPSAAATSCPAGTGQSGLGGVRLGLQPGDKLRIRFVNKLPVEPRADHIADNCYLINNPTNLHTHGLIVEPHRAVGPSDTYGDYIFLEIDNPTNKAVPRDSAGKPIPCPVNGHAHPGDDLATGPVSYLDNIEATHPPGLYWFHPHLHGLALNQVSAGLAGVLTIGNPADECGNAACRDAVAQSNVRHIVLKDTQVEKGGVLKTQEDPGFCDGAPTNVPRQGTCPGQNGGPGADYTGGTWVHTVNGQVYPEIGVGPSGDLWRILNASGSRSYALSLVDGAGNGKPLPVQLIAIDGVTINTKPGDSLAAIQALLGGKARLVECPGVSASDLAALQSRPVCATEVRMMPSARVQVRVVPAAGSTTPVAAVFRTARYDTGDTLNGQTQGDQWPAIDLAAVTLAARNPSVASALALNAAAAAALSPSGQLQAVSVLQVPGTDTLVSAVSPPPAVSMAPAGPALQDSLTQSTGIAITPDLLVGKIPAPKCPQLPLGHRRQILFGYPQPTTFGLGYVEVDANGVEVPGTRIPIQEFDPAKTMVCVPLPAGNSTYEIWELVNLTSEDHNFHIHQTRFFLLTGGAGPGTNIPTLLNGSIVLHDNVPLPHPTPPANAFNCDGTLGPVQSGACKPSSTFVVIPFREVGDFVFHCHILEHEDGGMMARIRTVVTAAGPVLLSGTAVK